MEKNSLFSKYHLRNSLFLGLRFAKIYFVENWQLVIIDFLELVCYTVKDLHDEKEIIKAMTPVITSKQVERKVSYFISSTVFANFENFNLIS